MRQHFGAQVAATAARRMVVPPHRDGGQAQYIARAVPVCESEALAPLLAWISENLGDELDVETLARHMHMSARTFARRFKEETGTTPYSWILGERVRAAEELLEQTDHSIDWVAGEVGFGNAATLRHHFGRSRGVSPAGVPAYVPDVRLTRPVRGYDRRARTCLGSLGRVNATAAGRPVRRRPRHPARGAAGGLRGAQGPRSQARPHAWQAVGRSSSTSPTSCSGCRTTTKDAAGVDVRNYGGLEGLRELREMFAELLWVEPEQVVAGGSSSLTMMRDCLFYLTLFGARRLRAAVGPGGEGPVRLPGAGLRPPLHPAREPRHRDGDRRR